MLPLNFKTKKSFSQKGFSMMEVLMAILTLTLFLTGTLQLVAIDTLYKMRSKQEAQAQFWIQEDLEAIRALANKTGSKDVEDIWYNAFCLPDRRTSEKDKDGNDIAPQTFAEALNNQIEARTLSNVIDFEAATEEQKKDFLPASFLRNLLAQEKFKNPDGTFKTPKNPKKYRMDRTSEIPADAPSVLRITYRVTDVNAQLTPTGTLNNDINKSDVEDYVIATHHTEIIPYESFKCR